MQLVTVGTKYQIVIPKEIRKKIKGLRPGSKVVVKSLDEETAVLKTQKQSWSDRSYGFMKAAWKGVNPASEIDKMRDEWEEKVRKTENELEKI